MFARKKYWRFLWKLFFEIDFFVNVRSVRRPKQFLGGGRAPNFFATYLKRLKKKKTGAASNSWNRWQTFIKVSLKRKQTYPGPNPIVQYGTKFSRFPSRYAPSLPPHAGGYFHMIDMCIHDPPASYHHHHHHQRNHLAYQLFRPSSHTYAHVW